MPYMQLCNRHSRVVLGAHSGSLSNKKRIDGLSKAWEGKPWHFLQGVQWSVCHVSEQVSVIFKCSQCMLNIAYCTAR